MIFSTNYTRPDNSNSEVGFEFPRPSHEEEDPPSKLIGQFLNNQRASGVDMPFDLDFSDHYLPKSTIPIHEKGNDGLHPRGKIPSKDIKISFQSLSTTKDTDHEQEEQHFHPVPEIHCRELHEVLIMAQLQRENCYREIQSVCIYCFKKGVLSTLDGEIHGSTNGDESSTQIRSEVEAKSAARKIFQNVARRGSMHIYILDLMRLIREDEALKTLALLGGAESEKISKYALKNWVVNAFRERKALALTLNDTKTAVNKLHQMVNILVAIVIVVFSLVILGFATSKVLLFISSQIVVVAFVFRNTCKTVFEAIIFLFVMRPFGVGNRCEIDVVQVSIFKDQQY